MYLDGSRRRRAGGGAEDPLTGIAAGRMALHSTVYGFWELEPAISCVRGLVKARRLVMSSPATVAAVMAGNDARAVLMWAVFGIPILQNLYFVYNSDSLSYSRVAFLLWMIPL